LAEKTHPDRVFLDSINSDLPIFIIHQTSHLGVLNSKGLQYFNITADTPDPPGGLYARYPGTNEPTGVLY
jgi:predicted amidohydrolase YtcJ